MQQAPNRPVNRNQRGAPALKFLAAAGALLALLMLISPHQSHAQLVTGDILGTVTDSTGAVVPGAKVTLLNSGTGIAASTQSSDTGEFLFTKVQIGSYKVTVEAKGFKTFSTIGVTLNASDRVRVTAKMEVGSQVETVQVEATEAVTLKTDSSDISATISSASLTDMPTNGRNYYDLMGYAPGTTTASEANDPRTGQRQSMAFSANGQTTVFNNNMIDGMDNNQRSVGLVAVEPSLDALQEVKVETNNYSAEYSRTGGGIANLITKSGTNQFHGSLFEFMRNDAFDAYPWVSSGTKTKAELRQNQFGGSLGGPILKNKAFFFGDYQGFRQIQGSISDSTVPTAEEYASIHAYAAAPGNGYIALQDRWDGYAGAQEFDIGPGATTTGSGPTLTALHTNIDPLGLAYLMEAPKPNCPGDTYCYDNGQNNYRQASNKAVNTDTYDGRVDYHINDYNTFFVRYSYDNTINNGGSRWPAAALVNGNSKTYLTGANDGVVTAQNGALDLVHIFNPTTVFEVKAGYAQSFMWGHSAGTSWTTQDVGLDCSANYCYNSPGVVGLPFMSLSGPTAANPFGPPGQVGSPYMAATVPYGYSGDPASSYFTENTFQYVASLTKTQKAHSMKMGLTLIRRQIKAPETSNSTPVYAPQNTPNILGDMLAGDAVSLSGTKVMITPHYRTWEPSAFFQDDWRATKALTLNLGVRYDLYTPYTEHDGYLSNFDPNTDLMISPVLLGTNHSNATAGIQSDYKNISPRVGFAWTLPGNNAATNNMVLRGGFGMSYFPGNTSGASMLAYQLTGAPFTWSMSCGNSVYAMGAAPCSTYYGASPSGPGLSDGGYNVDFNLPLATYDTSLATNPDKYVTSLSGNQFVALNFKSLSLEQFNLQLQKQMGNSILTAGFVGNLGRHIPTQQNLNQPMSSAASTTQAGYPMYSAATPWMAVSSPTGVSAVPVKTSFSGANSSWMAGEATYERRLTHGFSASVNYTWARSASQGTSSSECSVHGCFVDDGSGTAVQLDDWKKYNYTGSTSHRAAGMVTYNIPTLTEWKKGILGAITNGWALNGTGNWNTGIWNPITSGVSVSGMSSYGSEYPDRIPGVSLKPAGGKSLQHWFNPNAFKLQPAGMLGNAYQNSNYVQAPRTRDLDMSFSKTFSVWERFKLQFRAEAFNLTNTPNYDPPPPGPPPGGGPGGGGGGEYSITTYCPAGTSLSAGTCNPTNENLPGDISTNASNFTVITSVSNQSRIFQFALKLIY